MGMAPDKILLFMTRRFLNFGGTWRVKCSVPMHMCIHVYTYVYVHVYIYVYVYHT